MSHWQTGKLDLKCSLDVLKKAIINIMPEWEKTLKIDEKGGLSANFHGSPVEQKYQLVIGKSKDLYSDIGLFSNSDGTWEIGGDYSIKTLKNKLTGEVMRMRALAIARIRGYEVLRNEDTGDEFITEIRVDSDSMNELL
jgi:hypothetical protein